MSSTVESYLKSTYVQISLGLAVAFVCYVAVRSSEFICNPPSDVQMFMGFFLPLAWGVGIAAGLYTASKLYTLVTKRELGGGSMPYYQW